MSAKHAVRFSKKEEARALPILLRHSSGIVLRDRTYVLRIRAKITCPLGGVISAGGFHSSIRRETDAA
jgi:hypothetical protein